MKIKNFGRAAFFNVRVLVASLLCLAAGMFALLAFVSIAQRPDNKRETTRASRWLTQLVSSVGIESRAQPGGAIKRLCRPHLC